MMAHGFDRHKQRDFHYNPSKLGIGQGAHKGFRVDSDTPV
ncbi:MAG: hypothetical protein FD177_2846, partial [Desulfovibrionaceae bacterium]